MNYRRLLIIAVVAIAVLLFILLLDNRFGIISGTVIGKSFPFSKDIPVLIHFKKEAELDQEITLRKSEVAIFPKENLELKIIKFQYSPCPDFAMCVWMDHDVAYELTLNGQVYKGSFAQKPEDIPYTPTSIETDSNTFITFTVRKQESEK